MSQFCPKSGKIMHTSANAARRGVTRGNYGRPYRCEFCAHWHVSHHRSEIKTKKKWAVLAFGAILLCSCAAAPPKPIIQFKTVEVPKYLRAPIPAEYTVDRTVAEPAPACGKLYCNGQVASLIDDYRAALRQSNLDKAVIRQLQPTEKTP